MPCCDPYWMSFSQTWLETWQCSWATPYWKTTVHSPFWVQIVSMKIPLHYMIHLFMLKKSECTYSIYRNVPKYIYMHMSIWIYIQYQKKKNTEWSNLDSRWVWLRLLTMQNQNWQTWALILLCPSRWIQYHCSQLIYGNKLNLFRLTHLNPNWFTGYKLNVFRLSSMEYYILAGLHWN